MIDGPGSSVAGVQSYFYLLAAVTLTVFVVAVAKPILVPLALAIMFAFAAFSTSRWTTRRRHR